MSNRIMQLFYSKSSIMRALTNVDSACLKSTPADLSVGCKIEEPMVSGKPTITIHEKFFNYIPVVTGSDCIYLWSYEVTSSSRIQCGNAIGGVVLCVDLMMGVPLLGEAMVLLEK